MQRPSRPRRRGLTGPQLSPLQDGGRVVRVCALLLQKSRPEVSEREAFPSLLEL